MYDVDPIMTGTRLAKKKLSGQCADRRPKKIPNV